MSIDPKKQLENQAVNLATSKLSESNQKKIQTAMKAKDVAQKASMAQSALSGVAQFIATNILPILAIIVVAIVIFVVVAFGSIVGKTENADGCFGIGGGTNSDSSSSVNVSQGKDGAETAKNVGKWMTTTNFKFLGDKPMTKEQSAGILGNWSEESKLDPNIIQPGEDGKGKSNDDIIAMGSISGKGVGVAQWDGSRRTDLAQYAKEQGKKWNDLDVQLAFFKKELDSTHGTALASGGFGEKGKKPAEYAEKFNRIFEVSADFSSKRGEAAEKIAKDDLSGLAGSSSGSSEGNYSTKAGGSCSLGGKDDGGNADYGSVVSLATSIAWPAKEANKAPVSPSNPDGKDKAKPEYIEAKKKAEDKGGADPQSGLYASCDRFVATVYKNTIDKDIPWGATDTQKQYFDKSSKWKPFKNKSEAKPGDVMITNQNGHVVIYVGEVEGKDSIAMASYHTHVGYITDSNYISGDLVDQQGRSYTGYHFVG